MNQQLLTKIEQQNRSYKANRKAHHVAAALGASLRINQHGIELIEVLGNGEEKCNIEAIATWVRVHIGADRLADGNYVLGEVKGDLRARLERWLCH